MLKIAAIISTTPMMLKTWLPVDDTFNTALYVALDNADVAVVPLPAGAVVGMFESVIKNANTPFTFNQISQVKYGEYDQRYYSTHDNIRINEFHFHLRLTSFFFSFSFADKTYGRTSSLTL